MSADDDPMITPAEAGQHLFGWQGRTVRMHITRGTRMPDGRVIRLRAVRGPDTTYAAS